MKKLRDIDWSKCKTSRFCGKNTVAGIDFDGDPVVRIDTSVLSRMQIAVKDVAHGGWIYASTHEDNIDQLRIICGQVDEFIESELRGAETPQVKLPVKTKAPTGCTWERNDDGSVVLCVHGEGGHFDVEMPVNATHRDAYLACAEAYGEVFGGQVVHDIWISKTNCTRYADKSIAEIQAKAESVLPYPGAAKLILNGR